MKVKCSKCGKERSISRAGYEKRAKKDKSYPKNYVCRFCRGADRKARTKAMKKGQ